MDTLHRGGQSATNLVQAGYRIAVCLSGGKYSMLMAKLMQKLQRHSDVPFELVLMVMDSGSNEINRQKIESNADLLPIPVTIFDSNIFAVANNTDKNPCYLCARTPRPPVQQGQGSWAATRSRWGITSMM